MILWGIDRSDHFASPHNRVCQNMTFRWLCDDLNIKSSPGILKIFAFWLDLVAYQGFLKDSLTLFENPSNRLLHSRFPPKINIWTNPESWECKTFTLSVQKAYMCFQSFWWDLAQLTAQNVVKYYKRPKKQVFFVISTHSSRFFVPG